MRQLINNFLLKAKELGPNVFEAVCISDKDGIIFKEQYIPRLTRNIYSHSKSFTSLMVGIALDEGKLTLDTRLVDVFKDEIDEETYNRLFKITLKHLLSMRSGLGGPWLMTCDRQSGIGYPNYLKFLLSKELLNEPGEKFLYSNGDTYLCARMVEKVYSRDFRDLCYEKIFVPMEIGFNDWGVDPLGHCIAASSLQLNIENMNKLGILFLNKGMYKDKRIVSEKWIDDVYSSFINNGDYSLQFWRVGNDNKCLFASGMYGQNTYIFKDYGIAFSYQRPDDDLHDKVFEIFKKEVADKI